MFLMFSEINSFFVAQICLSEIHNTLVSAAQVLALQMRLLGPARRKLCSKNILDSEVEQQEGEVLPITVDFENICRSNLSLVIES